VSPCVVRIALADDHAVVRVGYRRLLELEPDLRVVAEYADADQAEAGLVGAATATAAAPAEVDLLILDLSMPGRNGLELLRLLQARRPALKVLVVSMHDSPAMVAQCLRAGAAGFVPKSSDPQAVVDAVREVARGRRALPPQLAQAVRTLDPKPPHEQLTTREAEVLRLLLAGASLESIARQMGLSDKTVSNYQTLVRQKLGVASAHELLHYAREHGLVS
jgi:DNA-binding NarL/FixJ family response regulator